MEKSKLGSPHAEMRKVDEWSGADQIEDEDDEEIDPCSRGRDEHDRAGLQFREIPIKDPNHGDPVSDDPHDHGPCQRYLTN